MVNTGRVKCVARVSQAITQYAPVPDPPLFSLEGMEMSSSVMIIATSVKESICNEDVEDEEEEEQVARARAKRFGEPGEQLSLLLFYKMLVGSGLKPTRFRHRVSLIVLLVVEANEVASRSMISPKDNSRGP